MELAVATKKFTSKRIALAESPRIMLNINKQQQQEEEVR